MDDTGRDEPGNDRDPGNDRAADGTDDPDRPGWAAPGPPAPAPPASGQSSAGQPAATPPWARPEPPTGPAAEEPQPGPAAVEPQPGPAAEEPPPTGPTGAQPPPPGSQPPPPQPQPPAWGAPQPPPPAWGSAQPPSPGWPTPATPAPPAWGAPPPSGWGGAPTGPQGPGAPGAAPVKRRGWAWLWALIGTLVVLTGLAIAAVVLLVTTFTGPADATNAYLRDLRAGRYAAAYSHLCGARRAETSVSTFAADQQNRIGVEGDIVSFDVNYSVVHANGRATTRYDLDRSQAEQRWEVDLVKEGGDWRLCHFRQIVRG